MRPNYGEENFQTEKNFRAIPAQSHSRLSPHSAKFLKNISEEISHLPRYPANFSSKIHASFRPDGIVASALEQNSATPKNTRYSFPPAVRNRLTPKNIWVDTGILGGVAASLFTHSAIFALLFVNFAHKSMGGDQQADAPQMEMIFAPPAMNSVKGERVKEQGGGSTPPPPTAAPQPNPTPAKTPVAPPVPPENLSETGEIAAQNPKEKPEAKKPSPTKTEAQANANASKISTSKSANNPFAHLTDISFDGDPNDMRHKKGQKGGNKGAIDMGVMGPLSVNGKINAPYSSSSTIKGVSSDYGAELDAWIRNHIFYPDDAVRQELEGATSVHVRLDRKGHVQQVFVKGPSGVASLDVATVSIFQGQKLPDVPEDMKGDHFDIDVQVNYLLIRH
ncbi:energy transducer TonB [Acetobacteraceae bacterium]|nr:energy transducer TonB [Acetobacteraceae bacterium]